MPKFIAVIFFLLSVSVNAQLSFQNQRTDLGTIAEAYEIKGDIIIKNSGPKKAFLLRADADKDLKVFASKKTLQPGDTCLLIVSFIPTSNGKFNRNIKLVSSDKDTPYDLNLQGNLLKAKTDDKTACFYFGSKSKSNVKIKDEPILVKNTKEPKDVSNKIPDNTSTPIETKTLDTSPSYPAKIDDTSFELSPMGYKPNNIVFLVDVSNSMKDSLKLPLMKQALYTLIDAVRDIDKITFLTYSDSVKVISEGVSGSNKEELKKIVASLKAKGLTKGNRAILRSQQIAQKHFIQEGNNQVIMATDGKFRFYSEDQKKWNDAQGDKKITLTTVAFGDDKEAMKNLKEIAEIGEGSFIHIKKKNGSDEKLLEEVKLRSKRD